MVSDDDARLLARARGAYERSRVRFALAVAAPVALIPLVSFALGTSARSASLLGAGLVGAVAVAMWRGGALALGGISGLKAGAFPLVLAHAAKLFGHVCTPAGCSTLCVPACAAGGLIAGALVEVWARRSPRPNLTRGLGLGVCLLTGALGCSCVGSSGLIALVIASTASTLASRVMAARSA
jgi:hypothetical protein